MPRRVSSYESILSMGDELGKHVDEWIAMIDGDVVAKGKNAKAVYEEAKARRPSEIPFIMKVPTERVMVL
jgi:hypothetical protein